MHIGQRLRELRLRKGLSQRQLAKAVGLSYGAIYNYEAGLRVPDTEALVRLADFFGTSVDALLNRDSPAAPTLSEYEIAIAKKVRELTMERKRSLEDYLNYLVEKEREERDGE